MRLKQPMQYCLHMFHTPQFHATAFFISQIINLCTIFHKASTSNARTLTVFFTLQYFGDLPSCSRFIVYLKFYYPQFLCPNGAHTHLNSNTLHLQLHYILLNKMWLLLVQGGWLWGNISTFIRYGGILVRAVITRCDWSDICKRVCLV